MNARAGAALALALVAGGAALFLSRRADAAASLFDLGALELDLGNLGDDLGELVMGDSVNAAGNVGAFLAMLGACEGAGYSTLFGGGTFPSFAAHPRVGVTRTVNGRPLTSTAAGRYQILAGTWDDFIRSEGPRDFSPASQDECAVWLIRRRGALADVKAGRFDQAIAKCAAEWASLPGSPYGQPVKTIEQARDLYAGAGGAYA